MFDLLLRVFLNKIEKEEDLNPGWNPDLSYPDLSSYHYTNPPTSQNSETFKYIDYQTVFLNQYINNMWSSPFP